MAELKKRSFCAGAALLCIVFALLMLSGCSSTASEEAADVPEVDAAVVRIGTMPTEDILPLWIAEDEGLFEEAGVQAEVITFDSAQTLSAALTAGEVDMAMTDIMRAVKLCESGAPVVAEWVTLGETADQGRFGVLAPAGAEYNSLSELAAWLETKKLGDASGVGVAANTVPEYVYEALCVEEGVDPAAIPVQEVPSLPERYGLVASGQLIAAALPNSLLEMGEANGLKVIADDVQGQNVSQSIMVARATFAEEHPESVAAVANAWNAAVALCNADPEAYRELLVQNANLNSAIAETYPISTYPVAIVEDVMERPTDDMVQPILEWMRQKEYGGEGVTYDSATGTFTVG